MTLDQILKQIDNGRNAFTRAEVREFVEQAYSAGMDAAKAQMVEALRQPVHMPSELIRHRSGNNF